MGSKFPDQGSNPGPLRWGHGVLTNGPPETSLKGTCFLKDLFIIYLWLCWVFIAVRPFSLIVAREGYSSLQCSGFSLQWFCSLWSTGSVAYGPCSCDSGLSSYGSRALEHKLCNCGTWAYLLHSMWDLPASGIEPVSLALQDGFLTTGPPGKS